MVALGEALNPQNPELETIKEQAYIKNNWFTVENLDLCLQNWSNCLTLSKIQEWLAPINEELDDIQTVGIVMAGNLPLVGLHDLISTLGSGNNAKIKLSQNDEVLMKFCIETLSSYNPMFAERIEIAERILKPDALIATGSNNTSRYFKYYFKNIPNIIRKNRTSIAVLDGHETEEELQLLADDIFQYFGLGCRSVTKIMIPRDYDLKPLLDHTQGYSELINHHKFANNYTYHKAIFLMNLTKHLDTGYLLVTENEKLHSPLACIFYEYYDDIDQVKNWLSDHSDEIQVVVSHLDQLESNRFGSTQKTTLFDYADGVNTLDFLSKL